MATPEQEMDAQAPVHVHAAQRLEPKTSIHISQAFGRIHHVSTSNEDRHGYCIVCLLSESAYLPANYVGRHAIRLLENPHPRRNKAKCTQPMKLNELKSWAPNIGSVPRLKVDSSVGSGDPDLDLVGLVEVGISRPWAWPKLGLAYGLDAR